MLAAPPLGKPMVGASQHLQGSCKSAHWTVVHSGTSSCHEDVSVLSAPQSNFSLSLIFGTQSRTSLHLRKSRCFLREKVQATLFGSYSIWHFRENLLKFVLLILTSTVLLLTGSVAWCVPVLNTKLTSCLSC